MMLSLLYLPCMAKQIASSNSHNALTHRTQSREYDVLSFHRRTSFYVIASMALNAKGCPARSYTGSQVGIITDDIHTKARILEVKTEMIKR